MSSKTTSKSDDDELWDAISNALARLFLDTDQMIEEAVRMWKNISTYHNVDTDRGRRELAFVLWKTLMSQGVIREKGDLEAVCGAEPNSLKTMSKKKSRQNVLFKRPSGYVDTLGSWLGLPFQQRRLINRYMRSFDLKNRHLTSKSPEVLAGASILFMYSRLRKKIKREHISFALPEYVKNITRHNMADLIATDLKELKQTYKSLPKDEVLENDMLHLIKQDKQNK